MFDINKFQKTNAETLSAIYGSKQGDACARVERAVERFTALYGRGDVFVFSVPGRSEICGNHTDHNRGEVFAASVDLDVLAVARPTKNGKIRVFSEGFSECETDISRLSAVEGDKGTSAALVRGVCDGFVKRGLDVCAFDCYMTSDVIGGSGLSSSAAFEDMIGTIENAFANENKIDFLTLSQISQYAENVHFGKPCGLMDQVACAAGGFVHINFGDPNAPVCERIPFDLEAHGCALCIVSTGGSHADLTDDYAAIPAEMKKVASFFGKDALASVTKEQIKENIAALRAFAGDRAILRALHFLSENERVRELGEALKNDDFDAFLNIINKSGYSSAVLLQNYFSVGSPAEQGITLAWTLAGDVLGGRGAVRVHGGGFAGTLQAFVPKDILHAFILEMERAFGAGCVSVLNVRPLGALEFA